MNLIFITCKICNATIKKLGNHLYQSHPDISFKTYYDTYLKQPNDGICKICGKQTKFDTKRRHYLACCSKECNNKYVYQQTQKALIKKYGVDNIFKSPELMAESYKNKDYSKRTLKTRQVKMAKYGDSGFCNVEKRKKTNIKKYGVESFTQTADFYEKRKNTMINKYGNDITMFNHELFIKTKQKYTYNNINFDSAWELAYYIWLKDHNIDFEYQPDISFDYEYNNKIHRYYPDFLVEDEIQEIKGTQFFENKNPNNKMICPYNRDLDDFVEAKHQCMIKNNIKIITDCTEYLNYIRNTYGNDYLKQFK